MYKEESSWSSSSTSHYSPFSSSWGSVKNKLIYLTGRVVKELGKNMKKSKRKIPVKIIRKVKNTFPTNSTGQRSNVLNSRKTQLALKNGYMAFNSLSTTIAPISSCFHLTCWLEHQKPSHLLYFSWLGSAFCCLTVPSYTESWEIVSVWMLFSRICGCFYVFSIL